MLENCHILDEVIVQNHAVEGELVCLFMPKKQLLQAQFHS